jgi:hypothetical protein
MFWSVFLLMELDPVASLSAVFYHCRFVKLYKRRDIVHVLCILCQWVYLCVLCTLFHIRTEYYRPLRLEVLSVLSLMLVCENS